MKLLPIHYFIFFLLFACAWSQKEFDEDVSKGVEQSTTTAGVDSPMEEALAKEFQVSEVAGATATAPSTPVVVVSEKPAAKPEKEKKIKKHKLKSDEVAISTTPTVTENATVAIATEEIDYSKLVNGQFKYPDSFPEELQKWDQKNKSIWESLSPKGMVGEETFLDVSYLGMVIGKVFINVKKDAWVAGKEAYHYYARLKSAPFYSFAYTLDDYVESFVQKENYVPLKFSLVQRESNKSIDNIELFDQKKLTGHLRYKKIQDGNTEKEAKDFPMPHLFQDSLSAFFFLRGLPLNTGDVFDFPLSTKNKITIFSVKVVGRETIDTELGERKAIKMSATTRYSGEMVEKGQSEIWFSDDQYRIFLKLKAKVKFGAIDASVVEFRPGK